MRLTNAYLENFVARIAGVNIPTNKRVIIALTYIHGIGPAHAKALTTKLNIADDRRVQDLTDQEVLQIREAIDADYTVEGHTLSLELKYNNRERSLSGLRRVSKPGLRVYAKSTELPEVLGGLGVAIISTSHGLMTDRQAKEKGVGGEVLAYVW